MKNNAQNQTEKSNKPSHSVYVVKEVNGKKIWNRVGAAWPHSDGDGLTQVISLLDMDVTLTVRRNKEKPQS